MAERADDRVILIDGPMAGHLVNVPPGCWNWVVRPPQPITIGPLTDPSTIPSVSIDPTVHFRIETVDYYNGWGARQVRIGYSAPQRPDEDDMLEYVPTGLAEMGILTWDEVPETVLDRTSPIPIVGYGDVSEDCAVKVSDPHWIPTDPIDASCACGWRTEWVALDRRSQLVRAANRHAAGEEARRVRYHEPVRVISEGSGARPDCYGGIADDRRAGRVFGRCRRCGWQTEAVEYYRTGPLRDLCQAHTGPDGVRAVRDQLLAAFGLPPADEEEAR